MRTWLITGGAGFIGSNFVWMTARREPANRPGPAKMLSEPEWQLKMAFGNSLPNVVQWYLDHREWAKEIRSGEYKEFYDRQYGER